MTTNYLTCSDKVGAILGR